MNRNTSRHFYFGTAGRGHGASIIIILVMLAALPLVGSRSAITAKAKSSPLNIFLPFIQNHASIGTTIAGCPVFPSNNIWNTPIDKLPADPRSDGYIQTIKNDLGERATFHPDFGPLWNGVPMGIPYIVVPGSQPKVEVSFDYADESDPGPYPIPDNPPIEGGPDSSGDRHVLIVDKDNCLLYELYSAYPQAGGSWEAGSGAIFDLRSNQLRPDTWTSADAAGLSIFAGLVRYEEFEAGVITHPLRFTVPRIQRAYVWPARHFASSITDPNVPPMGQRFRLKASFDISRFSREEQIFLKAFQTYGLVIADNGSDLYVQGAPDERWDIDWLHHLFNQLYIGNFEAVDLSGAMIDPDSGEARQ